MASDPRTYGARCDECWLSDHREGTPVDTELKTGTSALVVADYPSRDDAKSGRLLSGEAGIELERALEATGKSRTAVSISSVVLCHPQGGDMDKVIRAFKKENKRREKEGEPSLPTPNECCRPRLHAEMRAMAPHMGTDGALNLVTLGKGAFQGVARKTCSIFEVRGGPHTAALRHDGSVIEGEAGSVDVSKVAALAAAMDAASEEPIAASLPLRILPTLDPFIVTKARRWTRAFRADMGRAIRWFEGRLGWTDPDVLLRPTVAEARAFFSRLSDEVSYDVETDALEAMTAKLRCIGFSTAEEAIVVPFLSRDGQTRFYTDREEAEMRALLTEVFLNPNIFKIGHNLGSYDRQVIEHHFGITPSPIIDGLVVHKSVEPELPHNLGYVGSMYTDVLAWKAGHTATQAATDEELWRYCLHHGTMVQLYGGGSMTIQDIVSKKMPVDVVSRTEDGRYVSRRVIGWHQQLMQSQEWKRIRLASSMQNKRGLIATPEHEIHTLRGRVRADQIVVGDEVFIDEKKLAPEQLQAIIGTCLGDTSIVVSPTQRKNPDAARSAALSGGHVVTSGFAQHKAEILGDFLRLGNTYLPKPCVINGRAGIPKEFQPFTSPMMHQIAKIRPLFYYPDGSRRLCVEALERAGAIGLAWWFMDDGCRQNGLEARNRSDSIVLSCQRYWRADVEAARDWLDAKFGPVYLGADRCLRFSIAAAREFCTFIAPHLPESARYKLPHNVDFPEYVPYTPSTEHDLATSTVVLVEDYLPPQEAPHQRLRARTRYCLTVEETHNFMTADGLVQNCATDCVVVARSLPHTLQAAALRKQEYAIAQDHRVQSVCVGLHQTGQLIDQARRHEHDLRLLKDAQKYYTQCIALGGIGSKFNPGSAHQVRDLLFEKWNLSVPTTLGKKKAYTKSGDPSTGDDMILALRTSGRLTKEQAAFLDALRKYRKAAKLRGSYILPLRSQNSMYVLDKFAMELGLGDDDLDPNPDAPTAYSFFEDRFSKDNKKRGLVWADGRVRADYNIGPTTGRLSCSGGINLQTPPEKLRDMFIPGDGMVFVYADADQLELRLIAALAQSERYLHIFNNGGDAHAISASLAFGAKFDVLEKDSPDWESMRKFAKILSYASGYGANIDTVLDVIRSVEDDAGNLLYANVTKAEATKIHSNWLDGAGVRDWWERNMDTFRKQHFMAEPVWGRRRDFLDGEDFCAIQNFACQCVPGWTRVLTKEGYIPIDQLRGREVVAWTGKRWATARVIAKGTKELYRMHTARGQFFTCDDDHKGKFIGTAEYEWRRFVEGGQNSRFAIDLAREQEFGEPMDPMDAYVAGYWTGDGSATPDSYYSHAISFVVANTKPDEQDPRAGEMMWAKLRKWAESRSIELSREEHEGCSSARFYKGTTEWLRSIGADPAWKAATKRVPEAIWRADLAARKAFLVGMLDADGYATESGGISLNLCQHALLQDIMLLARTVGVEGTISDPQKVDQKGHIAWKLMLNGSQSFTHLGWGRECKLRTSIFGSTPRFEARRVVDSLNPVTESEKVIRNRIRANPNPPAASPYMLTRMGAEGLYDHDKLISISSRRICVPVYTLSVDDEDHQYVAEGIISKNSGGAAIMHEAVLEVVDAVPFGKWGPGTGLVNYMHDAVLVACPAGEADKVVEIVNAAMNRSTPALPVRFTSKAKIKHRWSEPKKKA